MSENKQPLGKIEQPFDKLIPFDTFMPDLSHEASRRYHYRKFIRNIIADFLKDQPICEKAISAADKKWKTICKAIGAGDAAKDIILNYTFMNRSTLHEPDRHAMFWSAIFSLEKVDTESDESYESLKKTVENVFGSSSFPWLHSPTTIDHVGLLAQMFQTSTDLSFCDNMPNQLEEYENMRLETMQHARSIMNGKPNQRTLSGGGADRTAKRTGLAIGALVTVVAAFMSGPVLPNRKLTRFHHAW